MPRAERAFCRPVVRSHNVKLVFIHHNAFRSDRMRVLLQFADHFPLFTPKHASVSEKTAARAARRWRRANSRVLLFFFSTVILFILRAFQLPALVNVQKKLHQSARGGVWLIHTAHIGGSFTGAPGFRGERRRVNDSRVIIECIPSSPSCKWRKISPFRLRPCV